MKQLVRLIELKNQLKDIERKISFISGEIDIIVDDLVNYLESNNLLYKVSVGSKEEDA